MRILMIVVFVLLSMVADASAQWRLASLTATFVTDPAGRTAPRNFYVELYRLSRNGEPVQFMSWCDIDHCPDGQLTWVLEEGSYVVWAWPAGDGYRNFNSFSREFRLTSEGIALGEVVMKRLIFDIDIDIVDMSGRYPAVTARITLKDPTQIGPEGLRIQARAHVYGPGTNVSSVTYDTFQLRDGQKIYGPITATWPSNYTVFPSPEDPPLEIGRFFMNSSVVSSSRFYAEVTIEVLNRPDWAIGRKSIWREKPLSQDLADKVGESADLPGKIPER